MPLLSCFLCGNVRFTPKNGRKNTRTTNKLFLLPQCLHKAYLLRFLSIKSPNLTLLIYYNKPCEKRQVNEHTFFCLFITSYKLPAKICREFFVKLNYSTRDIATSCSAYRAFRAPLRFPLPALQSQRFRRLSSLLSVEYRSSYAA